MKLSVLAAAVLLALSSLPVAAQSYSFSIFAGTPPPTGSRDGAGSEARFSEPIGVAVDSAGNSYVADRANGTVRKITPAGVVTTLAGSPGNRGSADGTGSAARFNEPNGIAVDAAGNVFVTDRAEHTVRRITPAGVVTTFAGVAGARGSADGTGAAARFSAPFGIAVDSGGNLYVSDTGNSTLRKITPAGVVSTLAGSPGVAGNADGAGAAARFAAPAGVAVDANGNVYVVDSASHVVRKITPAGVVSTLAGQAGTPGNASGAGGAARFNTPFGIAADANGTVFVADTINETIRRVAPDGTVSTIAGSSFAGNVNGTGTAARFFRPQGIAVDAAGNLYVADTYNHSIRRLNTAAVTTTLAGGGGNFGSADGSGPAARFNRPRGLAVDSQRNVFVSDSFNNTIRKIPPAGVVTTLAGVPGALAYVDGPGSAARFGSPYGATLDTANNLYVVDSIYHAVRRITPAGVVSTWAGTPDPNNPGSIEGAPGVARVNTPLGVVAAPDGSLYIADSGNHSIRRVSPTGVLSTFAGLSGSAGSADGTGPAARFRAPSGVAIDGSGNVYVADYGNSTIRKITPAGVVSTLAGSAGNGGYADGTGAAARFDNPDGVAVDAAGNVYVSDSNNHVIRKVTPAGVVTTIGGIAGAAGVAEGTGSSARFFVPSGIAVDANGVIFVLSAFGNVVMRGALDAGPSISAPPLPQTVVAGSPVSFTVGATGGGLVYQWKLNGANIAGATNSTYTIPSVSSSHAGSYTVEVSNTLGAVTSSPAMLTIVAATNNVGRLINLSILTEVASAGDSFTMGYVVGGGGTSGSKPILIRAAGPSLAQLGVASPLTDPKLELYRGSTKTGENDNWGGSSALSEAFAAVGAFSYISGNSLDSATLATIPAGDNSVKVSATGTGTGAVIAEIYDSTPTFSFTPTTPRLLNISVLKHVGGGMTAGFYVGGETSKTVLIRAIGPSLDVFNVVGRLANPQLELFQGQTKIGENDDWGGAPNLAATFASVGAFEIPAASQDAVLLVTLAPGSYTARVSGVGGTTGVAIVEVYDVP